MPNHYWDTWRLAALLVLIIHAALVIQLFPCHPFTGLTIPVRLAKPFIIGVFYGTGKPDIDAYFDATLDELINFSPLNRCRRTDSPFVVELRLMLGDAPMRAWMTGKSDEK